MSFLMPPSKFKRTCKEQRRKTGNLNSPVTFWVLNAEAGWGHMPISPLFQKMYLNVAHIISNTSCLVKIACGMRGSKNRNFKIVLI